MARFHLEKWYLDVADQNGNAFIGYMAHLKWKGINLSYNGFTFLNSAKEVTNRNSFSQAQFPTHEGTLIQWKSPGCSGAWHGIGNSISEILLSNDDGEVKWHCHFPKATANVHVNNSSVNGTGYVEFIELTIYPWKLPIHQLHWGRFLAEEHTLVWIRWIGPVPKTIIYHNGKRLSDAVIEQHQLRFEEFTLTLTDAVPMRKGTLLRTVFSRFPSLAKLFPKAILQLQENKWYSHGTLYQHDKKVASGKAIHEVVEWK